jgi:predicted permease
MEGINLNFVVSLIIIGLGFFTKKIGIIKESDGDTISKIIFNITLPALVLNTFSTIEISSFLLLLPVLNISICLFMLFISLVIFKNYDKKKKGIYIMLLSGYNIGLFAYPLIEMIWGANGLKYFGMFDIGNAFIVFGSNYIIASIYANNNSNVNVKRVFKKMFKSVPFIAYILALIISLLPITLPNIFIVLTENISRANMPLSLLLLGFLLSFNFKKDELFKIFQLLSIRYLLGIIIGVSLYIFMPFDELFKSVLLIGTLLPVSMAVIPYSIEFNYDKKFIGTVNTATIIISFIFIWLSVYFIN